MRPGLVLVGVAFLAVASVSSASLYLWPATPSTKNVTTEIPETSLAPNETRQALLAGTNTSSGSFAFQWESTGNLDVALYEAPRCRVASLSCAERPAVADWTTNESGTFSIRGPLEFPYLLVWTAPAASGVSFHAHAESMAEIAPPEPEWATLATVAALVFLGTIGGVACFLGFFLRRGVFHRAPAGDRATAASGTPTDRVEPPVTGPRTGSPDDGGGLPRRGPPSPGR